MKRVLFLGIVLAVVFAAVGCSPSTPKLVGQTAQSPTERPFPVASFTPSPTVFVAVSTPTVVPTLTVAQAQTALDTLKKALGPDPCLSVYRVGTAVNLYNAIQNSVARPLNRVLAFFTGRVLISMSKEEERAQKALTFMALTCKMGPIIANLLSEQ